MAILRDDPYSAQNFRVTINGVLDDGQAIRGSFAEVSGLDIEITPIETLEICHEGLEID
jgi:hypothetical protein